MCYIDASEITKNRRAKQEGEPLMLVRERPLHARATCALAIARSHAFGHYPAHCLSKQVLVRSWCNALFRRHSADKLDQRSVGVRVPLDSDSFVHLQMQDVTKPVNFKLVGAEKLRAPWRIEKPSCVCSVGDGVFCHELWS